LGISTTQLGIIKSYRKVRELTLKSNVKALLVDLDGTLVDSREAYVEAFRAGMSAIGRTKVNYDVAFEVPRRLEVGLPIDELVGSRSSVKRFLETYLATYYAVTLDRSRPFPNVFDALETLSGRFSLALITMRFVDNKKLMEELRKLGFLKYFRVVVTALDVRSPKPSPEALLKCARCLNVSLRQCVTVGDSVVDVRAGKLAGTKTVAVISGLFSREELEKEQPDVIIQNFSEIPSLLL